ncbi:uncharacterized protein RSE6_03582 [Rhynchosporium secalis]|uniref:SAM domain-containing protein n=1 Tax=Rhynchosporium secalis TaxID=38038 RepID=A0A1E1M336_RHYSE|nr:uncharacterized protein RSE6_03582 [Rhynchosporium secalis]
MDLQFVLAHLGITVYWPLLFETGFETWEILKDITERDMEAIGMKLGHRRRLQREIATSRGHPTNAALEQSAICCCSTTGGPRNCEAGYGAKSAMVAGFGFGSELCNEFEEGLGYGRKRDGGGFSVGS